MHLPEERSSHGRVTLAQLGEKHKTVRHAQNQTQSRHAAAQGSMLELVGFDLSGDAPTLARLSLDGETLLDITYTHVGSSVIEVRVLTRDGRVPVYVQAAAVIEGSLMLDAQFNAGAEAFSEIQFT